MRKVKRVSQRYGIAESLMGGIQNGNGTISFLGAYDFRLKSLVSSKNQPERDPYNLNNDLDFEFGFWQYKGWLVQFEFLHATR